MTTTITPALIRATGCSPRDIEQFVEIHGANAPDLALDTAIAYEGFALSMPEAERKRRSAEYLALAECAEILLTHEETTSP